MAPVTSRSVAILGSTGSIGTQALEVIAAHPGAFTVAALTAGGNVELLARQAVAFDVPLVGVARGQVEEVRAAIAAAAAHAGRPASVTDVVVGADAATIAAGCGAGYGGRADGAGLLAGIGNNHHHDASSHLSPS